MNKSLFCGTSGRVQLPARLVALPAADGSYVFIFQQCFPDTGFSIPKQQLFYY